MKTTHALRLHTAPALIAVFLLHACTGNGIAPLAMHNDQSRCPEFPTQEMPVGDQKVYAAAAQSRMVTPITPAQNVVAAAPGMAGIQQAADLEIEHIGFSDAQVAAYTARYFQDKSQGQQRSEALLKYLRTHPSVHGTAHVPINLQILCSLWDKDATALQQAGASMTGLYRELVQTVWERYEKSDRVLENVKDAKGKLYRVLGSIALAGLQQDARQLLIDDALIEQHIELVAEDFEDNTAKERKMLYELLYRSSFLRATPQGAVSAGKSGFLHLTLQEYFAGKELARQLLETDPRSSEAGALRAFLRENKYKSEYCVMLAFMAGEAWQYKQRGSKQAKGLQGLAALLKALNAQPQEAAGLQHLLLQLRTVSECLGLATAPEQQQIMQQYAAQLQALGSWIEAGFARIHESEGEDAVLHEAILALAPGITQCLDTKEVYAIYASKASSSANEDVRMRAIRALGELVSAAPQLASESMRDALIKAAGDRIGYVRQAAASALGELARAAPQLASNAMRNALLKAAEDNYWGVRAAASRALGKLAQADNSLAPKALDVLLKAAGNKNDGVRAAAASALRELSQADKRLTPKALEALLKAVENSRDDLSATARALGVLAQVDNSLAPNALKPLLKAEGDEYTDVRKAAAWALEELLKADNSLAPKALEPLLKAAGDSRNDPFGSARFAAFSALVTLAKADKRLAPKALEALFKAACDEHKDVRTAAYHALGKLAQAEKSLAPKVLALLLKAAGDSSEYVRSAAAYALGELVKAEKSLAPKALAPLIKAVGDADKYVCKAAASVLGEIAQADKSLAPKALEHLLKAMRDYRGDESVHARSAAFSVMGLLTQADKSLAPKALDVLLKAVGDEHKDVRKAAAWALGQLTQADKSLAPKTLEPLLKAAGDSRNDRFGRARSAALHALVELAKAESRLAPKALERLLKAARDAAEWVRKEAIRALGQLVSVDASLNSCILPVLLNAARDDQTYPETIRALKHCTTQQFVISYCQFVAMRACLPSDNIWKIIDAYRDEIPLHELLLPHLLSRLYTQSLVLEGTQLTLYQAVGEPLVWHMEEQAVALLQATLRRHQKTLVSNNGQKDVLTVD